MTRILPAITLATATFLAAISFPALADPVTLNFESLPTGGMLPDGTRILNTYAGFHFSDNVWSVLSNRYGGSGDFYGGAPGSDRSVVTLFDSTFPSGDLMTRVDVDRGFGTSFSLNIATVLGTKVSVKAFDASGHLLQQAFSSGADGTRGCLMSAFCNWEPLTLSLASGVKAAYVELRAPVLTAWLDDMTFGDVVQGTVPEPDGVWLGMAALGALALSRRLGRR